MTPTPAQLEILRWLLEHADGDGIRGGTLVDYYAARHRRETGNTWAPSTGRTHGYRRNGGLQLRRMADAGLLRRVRTSWGTPVYEITPAGRDAAERR